MTGVRDRRGGRAGAALAAAAAVVLLVSGCSSADGTGDKGYVTADGTASQVDPDDRDGPVELTGEDLDGQPMDLADLRGGVAVVNVWGSWCPPCRAEMPDLLGAVDELGGTAEFVGINIREPSPDTAKAFVRSFDVPYPSFYSFDGQALLPFSGTLTPNSIPSTLVLDPQGRVAASVIGPLPSQQTLVDLVQDVADESGADAGADSGADAGAGTGTSGG